MRVLKIIIIAVLGIAVLVVAAFYSIGIFRPEVTYQNTVTVNESAGKAWQVFQDTAYLDRWLPGMISIEPIKGEPMTAGSTYKLTFMVEGERMEMTEEVIKVDSARLFAFNLDNEVLSSTTRIQFTETDSLTTQLLATTTAEGKGLLWKSIISLSGSMMQEQGQQTYDSLKAVIESLPDSL